MRVGFVGWRGMVGSVLRARMLAEGDFAGIEPSFFSTSNAGGAAPDVGQGPATLADARDLEALAAMDVVVTCQGSAWSAAVYEPLRAGGWAGFWIDASSHLRTADEATLILDPVNRPVIDAALAAGGRTFCGPNCTVSLLLMGLAGLFRAGLVEWASTMSYQSASGAGAQAMRELVAQMAAVGAATAATLADPAAGILEVDAAVSATLHDARFPTERFGAPLAGSIIPWIDSAMASGQTREEWKSGFEAGRILGAPVPIDGICVRVGAMRCHAQAVTLKLIEPVPLPEIERLIAAAHPWVEVVPNTPEATRARLTAAATAGSLMVPVGRLRPMILGPEYLAAFTVGDQLLWGAAEPLRRMLLILRGTI